MAQKNTSLYTDGEAVFVLTSEDNENLVITELTDDATEFSGSSKTRSVASTKPTDKATKPSKAEQMQLRHDSRSSLLTKMEKYCAEEANLLKQLAEAVTEDGMHSSLLLRERQDIEDELERCRARQAQDIVASINEYKPRLKTRVSTTPATNTAIKPIEHILADVMSVTSDSRSIRSITPGTSNKNCVDNLPSRAAFQRRIPSAIKGVSRKQPKSKPTQGSRLFRNDHALREPNSVGQKLHLVVTHSLQAVLEDHRSKDNQSNGFADYGDDVFDEPKPTKQSLLQLVESNTRTLNPLELGRRNRVDSVRRV